MSRQVEIDIALDRIRNKPPVKNAFERLQKETSEQNLQDYLEELDKLSNEE